MNEVIKNMEERRSVRSYKPDMISKEDLDAIKAEYEPCDDQEAMEMDDDFDSMLEMLDECDLDEQSSYPWVHCSLYPDELTELFAKYDDEWWNSDFTTVGQRISPRVILWAVGYRMAMQQLQLPALK